MMDTFIRGMAIANPTVRFMLRHNKKLCWQHASSLKGYRDGLLSVYGSVGDMVEFSQSLNEKLVDYLKLLI